MRQSIKEPIVKSKRQKYKFSEKEERFICNRQNHRKSEEACDRRYSIEIRDKFKIKCKSKDQKNKNYLKHCRKVEEEYKINLKKNDPDAYQNRMKGLKRCEICLDPVNSEFLVFCNICEDGYHCYCLKPPVLTLEEMEYENFTCTKCLNLKENQDKYRQTTMDESFTLTVKKNQKKCFSCNENIFEKMNYFAPSISSRINKNKYSLKKTSNKDLKIVLNIDNDNSEDDIKNNHKTCSRCKKDFHIDCYSKRYKENHNSKSQSKSKKNYSRDYKLENDVNKNICHFCEDYIKKQSESMKISDFFKYEKNKYSNSGKKTLKEENEKNNPSNDIVMFDFTEKKNENVAHYPKFILWKQLPNKKAEQLKENLKNALIFKNIDFSDDLAFIDPDCPESMNNSKLEPGIQKMSSYNKGIFYKFKERTRKGEYPGLEIIEDPIQGHIVKAAEEIKKNSLICEYTGEVCYLRKKLFDTNDSIMELIRNPSSSSSLVICPEKKGNIARFISGINNSDKNARKKQNVNSSRYDIDGKVHVLLYASKTIKKGEILYYDYNAGGSGTYPTENFV